MARLSKDRRRQIVEHVAEVLKSGEPTMFAFEASCRHGIRASLCLQGWSWPLADATAANIVASALARLGAKRPRWREAQPEWTQEGFSPIERTRCKRCGRRLPEGYKIWCSSLCRVAWGMKRFRADQEAGNAAAERAGHAAR